MGDTPSHGHTKLGQFASTAISGNDILSSTLYVSGIAAVFAGFLAPVVLLCVVLVLFFYRTVYREVVEALPVNGGAYNALLNGTSKIVASVAGVMTILSYIATVVISGKVAVEYLFKFIEEMVHQGGVESSINFPTLVIPATILVLFGFAMLVISGVKDSAKAASAIFIFHIFTLTSFTIIGAIFILSGGTNFIQSNLDYTQTIISANGGIVPTLFFAFSASLLGVSGFESSANFVEEQKKGVFRKTLRNMTLGVAIFNPLIAMVSLSLLPINSFGNGADIMNAKDFLIAEVAHSFGGLFLLGWVAINAFLVLCGAVLTGYVGVSGLANRMALDECLPSFLLSQNKRGSHPRIILAFFALCTSILLITGGNLLSLAGVYTISFLGVMSLFAFGNLILRQNRSDLKRPYKAPILLVFAALISTSAGLIGNSLLDFKNDVYFLIYFIPTILFVILYIYRRDISKSFMKIFSFIPPVRKALNNVYETSKNMTCVAFIHHSKRLFDILNYIEKNESGHNVTIVHCKNGDPDELDNIKSLIPCLQKAGAFENFNIQFEYIDEEFGVEAINKVSNKFGIKKNKIFIGSIHHHHNFDYDDLGGVRIVF